MGLKSLWWACFPFKLERNRELNTSMFCIPPGPTEATCPVGVCASQSYLARAVVGLDCKSWLISGAGLPCSCSLSPVAYCGSQNPQQAPPSYPVLLHCRAQRQLQGNWKPWWYQHRQTHYSPASSLPGHLSFFSLFLSSHAQCNKNKVKATWWNALHVSPCTCRQL